MKLNRETKLGTRKLSAAAVEIQDAMALYYIREAAKRKQAAQPKK